MLSLIDTYFKGRAALPVAVISQESFHFLVIPNQLANQRIPFSFHHDPFPDINPYLILVAVDFFKTVTGWEVARF